MTARQKLAYYRRSTGNHIRSLKTQKRLTQRLLNRGAIPGLTRETLLHSAWLTDTQLEDLRQIVRGDQ